MFIFDFCSPFFNHLWSDRLIQDSNTEFSVTEFLADWMANDKPTTLSRIKLNHLLNSTYQYHDQRAFSPLDNSSPPEILNVHLKWNPQFQGCYPANIFCAFFICWNIALDIWILTMKTICIKYLQIVVCAAIGILSYIICAMILNFPLHFPLLFHYVDVIMGAIASQIASLTIVYSTVYSGADQRKHQSSALLAFVRGIHRDRWISRTNGQ